MSQMSHESKLHVCALVELGLAQNFWNLHNFLYFGKIINLMGPDGYLKSERFTYNRAHSIVLMAICSVMWSMSLLHAVRCFVNH